MQKILKGLPSKVNLIPFNPHPLSPFTRPSADRVAAFQRIVEDGKLSAFVRTTRGDDIDAACGQLVGQVKDRTKRQTRYLARVKAAEGNVPAKVG